MTAAPLVHELVPCPDPWDVARKLAHLPHLCYLDSSDRGGERGRYSYVMAEPEAFLAEPPPGSNVRCAGGPAFDTLAWRVRSSLLNSGRAMVSGLPPLQGGWVLLLGYELNRDTESRVPQPRADEFSAPRFTACMYDWVISFDHTQQRAWIIVHGLPDPSPKRRRAKEKLEQIRGWLNGGRSMPTNRIDKRRGVPALDETLQHPLPHHPGVTSNFSRDGYIDAVRKAVEYVHAGDVFQVNISQRLLAPLSEHPLELYGRLRQTSPSPFGCYFDLGDFQILSSSPERFLQLSADGEVSTRPIKGTRPRGKSPAEDADLLRDLTTNSKDRAENVMIVDLLRNDIGRVCEYGSVTVPKVCEVESFSHVHHLVSEVRGKLRPGMTAFDLLRASFPGGSVTGAPKVRAMEIIAELEPTARGPYCGSVGWIGFDGAMDTNILIRTMTAGRGWVHFPVGGGIVADSDPATEYEETLHKAAGMLKALKR